MAARSSDTLFNDDEFDRAATIAWAERYAGRLVEIHNSGGWLASTTWRKGEIWRVSGYIANEHMAVLALTPENEDNVSACDVVFDRDDDEFHALGPSKCSVGTTAYMKDVTLLLRLSASETPHWCPNLGCTAPQPSAYVGFNVNVRCTGRDCRYFTADW